MEPTVIAARCGTYRSLFDRRSGLLARYLGRCHLPGPELVELELVGPQGELFDLGLLRALLEQAGLCRQVLLVGPSQHHPALPWILRFIRDQGAVPSIALSHRDPPTAEALQAMLRFAGAVTVDSALAADDKALLAQLHEADIRVSAHLPLEDQTAEKAVVALGSRDVGFHIDRLLLAGRHGTGSAADTTSLTAARTIRRCRALVQKRRSFRVGLDARSASLVASKERKRQALLPRCEAGRTGLFVRHDGQAAPCSLLAHRPVGSLHHESLWRVWSGPRFNEFRRHLGLAPPCRRIAIPCGRRHDGAAPLEAMPNRQQHLDLRFGFATSSLCDRTVVALSPMEIGHILDAVDEWGGLGFFRDTFDDEPGPAPASWTSLEYFMNIAPLWGQDLARLHEQLVAGAFERQDLATPR